MSWLFIGPNPLSGIGQVMMKYSKNGDYLEFGEKLTKEYDYIMAFILPVDRFVTFARMYEKYAKRTFYVMTTCETYPVHPGYGELFKEFPNVLTPSEFCKDIFWNQFKVTAQVVPHYAISRPNKFPEGPYVFYTIGNLADPRKNINLLLEAFVRCDFGDRAKLLLKASCRDEFKVHGIKNVEVINDGVLSDEELEDRVHSKAHCYINCSHSEGVGMGAVEAAMRNKPVIMSDFGGLKEYVSTPFTIPCKYVNVGKSAAEFLFTEDMFWGQPDKNKLIEYMKFCFDNRITNQEHPETRLKVDQCLTFFSRV